MVKGRPLKAVRIEKEALHAQGDQVIITSSSGNEISREMPDGSGGLFTVSLVKALKGGADKDKDGWIESGELYEYVKEQVSKLSQDQQHPVMKGKKDIKLVADISGKIEKLKIELFKAYDTGEISELAFKNVKALIEGKSCEGEVVKDLKEAIDEYLMGKITLKMLILVIKPYGEKIKCQGVEKEKVEEAKKPKEKEQVYEGQGTAFLKLIPADDLAKGVKVYIDGKYAGDIKEDMFIKEVPAGKHSVEITGDKIKDITFNFEVKPYKDYAKEVKPKPAVGIVKNSFRSNRSEAVCGWKGDRGKSYICGT